VLALAGQDPRVLHHGWIKNGRKVKSARSPVRQSVCLLSAATGPNSSICYYHLSMSSTIGGICFSLKDNPQYLER